jgi:hypothetical protein
MIEYPVKIELHVDNEEAQFIISPDELHKVVSTGMKKQFKIDPDAPEEEKTLARVVRAAVKGALIAFGPKLLDLMFKSKDHPKPQKGDDIIEWYADMFARVLIAGATQGRLILHGSHHGQTVIIDEIRPVPSSESSLRTGGSEAGGTGDSEQDAGRIGL